MDEKRKKEEKGQKNGNEKLAFLKSLFRFFLC